MLFNEEIIDMVATVLQDRAIPLIVDPVMVATSGDRLLKEAAHESLVTKLFPLATLITPNIPEASVLVRSLFMALDPRMCFRCSYMCTRWFVSVSYTAVPLRRWRT